MEMVPAGNDVGFANQGTIDWTQLARSTVQFQVSILARLAAADISPMTLVVGHGICSNFTMSHKGRMRVLEGLEGLHSTSALGKVIWFGLGVQHVVRRLAETDQGVTLITLCGSLSAVLSPNTSAAILMALCQESGAPEELRPSPQQWKNLLDVCSPALRPTQFARIAEKLMSFATLQQEHEAYDHNDIADALSAIGRLSTGALQSITLAGGRPCGWLAALGHHFFGLDVQIRTADGITVYDSAKHGSSVQIRVLYGQHDGNVVDLASTTYFIRSSHSFFTSRVERLDSIISGTLPWDCCLSSAFGATFSRLLHEDIHYLRLVYLAGRVFEGLANAEPNRLFSFVDFQAWVGYRRSQRGRDFLGSTMSWFAELNGQQDDMVNIPEYTLDEAIAAYDSHLREISEKCACSRCVLEEPKYVYCLPALAETIIYIVWNLCSLDIHKGLEPYRSGLCFIHDLQSGEGSGPGYPTRTGYKNRSPKYMENLLPQLGMASVYHTGKFLFTSQLYPEKRTSFSATSVAGLAFYLDLLREVSDRPEDASLIHVVPGCIETPSGRRFDYVYDQHETSSSGIFFFTRLGHPGFHVPNYCKTYEAQAPQAWSPSSDLAMGIGSLDVKASILVEESAYGLKAEFHFSGKQGHCNVGVYMLFIEILRTTGLVHCSHRNCPPLNPPLQGIAIVDGEGRLPTLPDRKTIYLYRLSGNVLARCIGLLVGIRSPLDPVFLRQRECIPCCIKAAENTRTRPCSLIL